MSADEAFRKISADHARFRQLYEAVTEIHNSLNPKQTLHTILEKALELTDAKSASISLVNPTSSMLELEASIGLGTDVSPDFYLPVGKGITGWVAKTGLPAMVNDVQKDTRYVPLSSMICSELAVPFDVNQQVRGVLNVDAHDTDAFQHKDLEILTFLALQSSKAIGNTWLYEQRRFKASMFESLAKINETIQKAFDLEEALEAVTREACNLMSTRMCSVFLLNDTEEWLELKASHGAGESYKSKPHLHVDESFAGTVVRRGQSIQLADVRHSSLYQNTEVARSEGLVSMLSVPLMLGNDPIGVLSVYTGLSHSFSNDEILILKAFSNASATAIQRTRMNEDIRLMEEELRSREKLSALGLLAAEVAHEIRNPLTVMKMVYHALDLQFPNDDPRHEDAELLGRKMDQLDEIVERVLDFARQDEPSTTQVDVNRLVNNLYLLTRHKLKQHRIAFSMHLDKQLPSIQADAGQLEQALLNLTLNAIEAMPSGGNLSLKTLHLAPQNEDEVAIIFKDDGLGMDEKMIHQTKGLLQSGKPKGVGLGLMVVKRIIESHRGHLRIESKPGKGAQIEIRIPVEQSRS